MPHGIWSEEEVNSIKARGTWLTVGYAGVSYVMGSGGWWCRFGRSSAVGCSLH